jgi:hydrogenase maturation protein HypF
MNFQTQAGNQNSVISSIYLKTKMLVRFRVNIQGIVQGVGFRPYIFNLAKKFNLTGWVKNHSSGVTIEVQGLKSEFHQFIEEVRNRPPILAQITDFGFKKIPAREDKEFCIFKSEPGVNQLTLVSPDISTCDDCLKELLDRGDRRYLYPFINCTNCGPRFTIIKGIPYDRSQTTMDEFALCEFCRAEYENPHDRRFHAQPNACPNCGPELLLLNQSGKMISNSPILQTVELLEQGKIVAIKGLGGFHLAVDASREDAVQRLRYRKRRYEKPLALMCKTVKEIALFAEISEDEIKILESSRRPICLLRKKKVSPIADSVSPDNDYLGVMLPYTPLHYLILNSNRFMALVMTSGNISEEPIVYKNEEAFERLQNVADYFLLNNREIYQPADDSVLRVMFNKVSYIRRSRGVVPLPVLTKDSYPAVLAVGGHLKNTVCLSRDQYFFLSQHIGDLENIETLKFFELAINHLQNILKINPQLVVCDLHPEYLSTKWAYQQKKLPVLSVQHHHAHIAACMAEKELKGNVIGFALDGTGFGSNGTIWGGEILLASECDFQRLAHFKYVPLPGGEKGINEPWRMLLAYLRETGISFPFKEYFPEVENEVDLVFQMIERSVNSPMTSSCGRLFDAVAAACGLRYKVGYEGQAAMQLEALLDSLDQTLENFYTFKIEENEEIDQIDWKPMFISLQKDLQNGLPVAEISWKFHKGLVEILLKLALKYRKEYNLNRIVLSGGCFQNKFLSESMIARLAQNKFEVFYHTLVPPNDGGLSLGQAYIGTNKIKMGLI